MLCLDIKQKATASFATQNKDCVLQICSALFYQPYKVSFTVTYLL